MTKNDVLYEDVGTVLSMLRNNYNIVMFPKPRGQNILFYLGEGYFPSGRYIVSIEIHLSHSFVKVFKILELGQSCVFQKKYSNISDAHSLSKSVSLYKFLNTLKFR